MNSKICKVQKMLNLHVLKEIWHRKRVNHYSGRHLTNLAFLDFSGNPGEEGKLGIFKEFHHFPE